MPQLERFERVSAEYALYNAVKTFHNTHGGTLARILTAYAPEADEHIIYVDPKNEALKADMRLHVLQPFRDVVAQESLQPLLHNGSPDSFVSPFLTAKDKLERFISKAAHASSDLVTPSEASMLSEIKSYMNEQVTPLYGHLEQVYEKEMKLSRSIG